LLAAFLALVAVPLIAVGGAVLASPPPSLTGAVPFSTAYYDGHGELLRLSLAADERYRLYTKLEDISPDLIAATLAQEDRYFYRHPGVNPFALVRAALATYVFHIRTMGGSTVTMQLVRLRDNLDTRSIGGKMTQAMRALQIERHYSKDEILEAYLNLAPYGGNIHGAGTAALIYFHRPARDIAAPQAMGLAVIPQNPVKRFPLNTDHQAWEDARQRLFARLPARFAAQTDAMKLPLTVWGRDDLPYRAPHLVDSLRDAAPGHVATTIDLPTQTMIEKRVSAWMAQHRRDDLGNAAVMLLHVPTMEVRALVGSADFSDSAAQGQVDGTAARRSPGSTLKPFVYALALDQGLIHPETLLDDDPTWFAEYRPGNFDKRFIGKIPAHEALSLSRNVPAIALASRLRTPDLYEFLQDAGAGLPESKKHYGLSLVVGGAETDMRMLVRLYAMLADGGILRDVVYRAGQDIAPPRAVLSPEAALLTLTMIERPDPEAVPFAAGSSLPLYWKTGTSNGFRDAWTVGVVGPYVMAVWLGHFDGRPSPALVGVEAAAPLFFDLAYALNAREKLRDEVKPALKKLNLARVAICRSTGAAKACDNQTEGWFIPGKSPFSVTGIMGDRAHPDILSPRAGIAYVHSRRSAEPLRIPLEATARSAGGPYDWFADNIYIGRSSGTAPLFWIPPPGTHTVRIVDATGRSAARTVTIVARE
jgi:penicillin-binding protein 1C